MHGSPPLLPGWWTLLWTFLHSQPLSLLSDYKDRGETYPVHLLPPNHTLTQGTSNPLVRVARHLTPPPIRSNAPRLPRQARFRRPNQSQIPPGPPLSHQETPATRKPGFLRQHLSTQNHVGVVHGTTLEKLALPTSSNTYRKPAYTKQQEIKSHATAPKTRAPARLPSNPALGGILSPALGGQLAVPSFGGALVRPALGGVFHIPSIPGPLLTSPLLRAGSSIGRDRQGRQRKQSNLVRGAGGDQLECGVSRTAEERILGGQDAGVGQFPWTALIQIKGHGLDKMCAGTLLRNRYSIVMIAISQTTMTIAGTSSQQATVSATASRPTTRTAATPSPSQT